MNPDLTIREARFAGIDFESAGASRGRTDVAVQIGLACWSTTDGHQDPFVSYLASDAPITWSARKVHGICDEDLVDAPRLLELWPTVKRYLRGSVVVAHGKGTEKRFLRAFPGHGFGPWVDTLLISRAAWPDWDDHSLSAICERRQLTSRIETLVSDRKWHDALFDTVASLAVLEDIIGEFQLTDSSIEHLTQPDTSLWHRHRRA
ncbi:MAG: exonuclease domain-containing protein [Haloferula sp.]